MARAGKRKCATQVRSMYIYGAGKNISTKRAICHFDSTATARGASRLASQAECQPTKRIWYLSAQAQLFEAWSHLAPLAESRFDTREKSVSQTLSGAALLPVLAAKPENSTFSLNSFRIGSRGGLVEVAS